MKKFIISLIILIILAGVGFYFGWIQIQLSANEYGVIFTKTGGWEEEVIQPGDFTWRISRLLPTNLNLYTYQIETKQITVSSEGELPSASLYSTYIEGNPDLSYSFRLDLSYSLDPAYLPSLAQEEKILPDDLETYYASFTDRFSIETETFIRNYMSDFDSADAETVLNFSNINQGLMDHLTELFPQLEINSVRLINANIPDINLYQQARTTYYEILEARKQALIEAESQLSLTTKQFEQELSHLKEYAQILSEYPVLLDYFRLSGEMNIDPLDLQNLGSQSRTQE